MRMYDIIMKKRDGKELSKEEIDHVIKEYTNGNIPDYQMSAFLMAVYFNGMTKEETLLLTKAMAESGDMLNLSLVEGIKADKHSTGGVGDKTSLIVGPMMASLGISMAKMSGRGLGHTGGTIDKLESIPGFSTSISEERFIDIVNTVHLSIVGQTKNLAPADKKIYALRDVTATVDQMSLIASSIMSKKLAAGADIIVLDVKCGSGAFMKNIEDAKALAQEMVEIGTGAGRKTKAVITDMNEPLGCFVGNALEVYEAVLCLKGKGNERLMKVCFALGRQIVKSAYPELSYEEIDKRLEDSIKNGDALNCFVKFAEAQGGNAEIFLKAENPIDVVKTKYKEELFVEQEGYLSSCITSEAGMAALVLGAGRETKDSVLDLNTGYELHHHLGDYLLKGESLATIYANDIEKLNLAKKRLLGAYTISSEKPLDEPVIYSVIA